MDVYSVIFESAVEDCCARNKKDPRRLCSFLKTYQSFINSLIRNPKARNFKHTSSVIQEILLVEGGKTLLEATGFTDDNSHFRLQNDIHEEHFREVLTVILKFIDNNYLPSSPIPVTHVSSPPVKPKPKYSDEQLSSLKQVRELLEISEDKAVTLLESYNWSTQNLLSAYFDGNDEDRFLEAGVSSQKNTMRDDLTSSMKMLRMSTFDAVNLLLNEDDENNNIIANNDHHGSSDVHLSGGNYDDDAELQQAIMMSDHEARLAMEERKRKEDEQREISALLQQTKLEDELQAAISESKREAELKKENEELEFVLQVSSIEDGEPQRNEGDASSMIVDPEILELASKFQQFKSGKSLVERIYEKKSEGHYHASNASAFRNDDNLSEFFVKLSKKRTEVDDALGLKESGHVFVSDAQSEIEHLQKDHKVNQLAANLAQLLVVSPSPNSPIHSPSHNNDAFDDDNIPS